MNVRKMILSFIPAISGLRFLIKNENNFKFHLLALVVVFTLGFLFKIETIHWLFILLSSSLVLVAEAINTALEFCANEIDENYNHKVKFIKDVGAAAVFIAAVFALIVGLTIFFPYFKMLFY